MTQTDEAIATLQRRLQEYVGKPYGKPLVARDPVNLPMIRHLTDALGDRNPAYTDEEFARGTVFGGIVAPATSLQVWTMQGLVGSGPNRDPNDSQGAVMGLLEQHGYIGVVATNCEQTYHRYLRPGDSLTMVSTLESVVGPKRTGLGEGFFVTSLQTYTDQAGEVVGETRFRILKFRPGTGRTAAPPESASGTEAPAPAPAPPGELPPKPRDWAFFWDGLEDGELRIQRCGSCGRLRHPPRPSCPWCRSFERDHVVAGGRGEIYSYVVHHHPPVPGRDHPFVVALVQLEEGTRIVGNLLGVDPDAVRVGMPVQVDFVRDDMGRTLPQWRPREA